MYLKPRYVGIGLKIPHTIPLLATTSDDLQDTNNIWDNTHLISVFSRWKLCVLCCYLDFSFAVLIEHLSEKKRKKLQKERYEGPKVIQLFFGSHAFCWNFNFTICFVELTLTVLFSS